MEANVMVQTALLAVLPLIMQGLKKIRWVEQNKEWFCPLLCIIASVIAAYFLELPQWLLVGILTGAACNKIYDWVHDSNKPAAIVLILLIPTLMFSGCQSPRAQLAASEKVFTAVIENLTPYVRSGAIEYEDAAVIQIIAHNANQYLDEWHDNILNGKEVPPDVIEGFDDCIRQLNDYYTYGKKRQIELKQQIKQTEETE